MSKLEWKPLVVGAIVLAAILGIGWYLSTQPEAIIRPTVYNAPLEAQQGAQSTLAAEPAQVAAEVPGPAQQAEVQPQPKSTRVWNPQMKDEYGTPWPEFTAVPQTQPFVRSDGFVNKCYRFAPGDYTTVIVSADSPPSLAMFPYGGDIDPATEAPAYFPDAQAWCAANDPEVTQ